MTAFADLNMKIQLILTIVIHVVMSSLTFMLS